MTTLAIIAGAGGGIGRALLTQLAKDPPYDRVLALSRRPPEGWPATDWLQADLLDEAALPALAARIAQAGTPTRVIVATGRLEAPEKSMRALTLDNLARAFATNAAAPALLARHVLPLMPRDRPHAFAVLSARVGSIGDNRLGGWHAYRASKAALNMLVRTLAIEHARTHPLGLCVALHPGTVDTDLSRPFQSNVPPEKLFTPAQTARALLSVLDRLGPEQTGGFFAWDGQPVPW
jgi:short-subunit dehydrogenase